MSLFRAISAAVVGRGQAGSKPDIVQRHPSRLNAAYAEQAIVYAVCCITLLLLFDIILRYVEMIAILLIQIVCLCRLLPPATGCSPHLYVSPVPSSSVFGLPLVGHCHHATPAW